MKKFYTEKDIEDLFAGGTKSLHLDDHVALTELAYEKAKQLGLQLLTDKADTPPSAPVRPYLSEKETPRSQPIPDSVAAPSPALESDSAQRDALTKRIRDAVMARLGNQIDAKLLDIIIVRVLKAAGVK